MHSLQALTLRELNQVFDEFDLCNALITNLAQVATHVLELSPDAIHTMTACAKKTEPD